MKVACGKKGIRGSKKTRFPIKSSHNVSTRGSPAPFVTRKTSGNKKTFRIFPVRFLSQAFCFFCQSTDLPNKLSPLIAIIRIPPLINQWETNELSVIPSGTFVSHTDEKQSNQ
jgi:hypothetical protein